MRLPQRTLRFGAVGVAGFIVDVAVLGLLLVPAGPWLGRAISFVAATIVTWLLNSRLTFPDRRSGHGRTGEFLRYLGVVLGGGAVNYAVYSLVVWQFGTQGLVPLLAVAAGSLAGMALNLALLLRAVFRQPQRPPS